MSVCIVRDDVHMVLPVGSQKENVFTTLGLPENRTRSIELVVGRRPLLFVMNRFLEILFPPFVIIWLFTCFRNTRLKKKTFSECP